MTESSGPSEDSLPEPSSFEFSAQNQEHIRGIIARYPPGRQQSAVLPLLDMAQRQCGGWLPRIAMNRVAEALSMPAIRVYEVATFYSMFNLRPVGTYFLQACTTTPCWLRGSDEVVETCRTKLGIGIGETTQDKRFTLVEVECLGACVNAPILQVNDDFYEDMDKETTERLLDMLSRDEVPPAGSMTERQGSMPVGGATTLTSLGASRPGDGTSEGAASGAGGNGHA